MSYAGIFTDKNNVDHPVTSTLYGTCATAAATAEKAVVCSDVDTLTAGMTLRVVFQYGNEAATPTINVNSLGAKGVYRFGTTKPVGGNSWNAGAVVELFYDGTSFFMTNSDNLGTAAAKDVPASGNASSTQVVMGDDTRLTDARTPVSHTHTKSEITDFPTLGTAAAKDATDSITDGSTALVESGAVYDALALKQDATDNSLDTTAKTIVGAINEHEGDIGSLKSGLTNVDVALSVPEGTGKNLWTNVVYKSSTGINSSGNEYSVDAYNLYKISVKENTNYVLSLTDTESLSSSQSYRIQFLDASDNALGLVSGNYGNVRPNKPFTTPSGTVQVKVSVRKLSSDIQLELGSTETAYTPYIPSVESRIEGLENGSMAVYTNDADLYNAFYGNANYNKTVIIKDSTKAMALLSATDQTSLFVRLTCHSGMWNNHPSFMGYVDYSYWVGTLTLSNNTVAINHIQKIDTTALT